MKTIIKSKVARMLAFALVFIAGSALAAEPVACWAGFRLLTLPDGSSVELNDNVVAEDGSVTIGTKPIKINIANGWSSDNPGWTLAVKYRNLNVNEGEQRVLSCYSATNKGTPNNDLIGFYVKDNYLVDAIWDRGVWGTKNVGTVAIPQAGVFCQSYNSTADQTQGYAVSADGETKVQFYTKNGLAGGGRTLTYFLIGGTTPMITGDTTANLVACEGLVVEAVAVFNSKITSADALAQYVWPDPYVEPRNYTWESTSGDWNEVSNWFVGEDEAVELPTKHDFVYFNRQRAYTINIPAEGVEVRTIYMNAENVFTGGAIKLNDFGLGSTIKGKATYLFEGKLPNSSVFDDFQSDSWKGTVWINNATDLTNIDFTQYGNANTTVKCSGVSGYLAVNKEFTGTLELENGDAEYGYNIHNGSSGDANVVTFDHLTGAGKLFGDGGSTAGVLVKEWAGYTGDIELVTKTVSFGDIRKADVNKIIVNPGFAYTLVGQTWTAAGGIQIDGTIGGKGTLTSATTFGLDAALDASGAELLTMNAMPTFALTNSFVLAAAPVAGEPVKVVNAGTVFTSKVYDVVPVVVVDGVEVEGEYQVKATADGIYLEKVSGNYALESAEPTILASAINAQLEGADDSSIVTITLNGEGNQELVLDESVKGGDIKIIHDGMLTITATEKPADFVKYDLRAATGFIRYSWLAMKRVINLNFREASGMFAADDMTFDGLLAGNTPKASWINLGNEAVNEGVAVTNAWNADTFEAEEIEGMTISWAASTVYAASHTIPVMKGYLDDGNADGVKITLTGVPFKTYDIIVYYNTDMENRVYPAVKVNGAAYTWDAENETTVPGNANWGRTYRDDVAYGVNALRIHDIVGNAVITTAQRNDGMSLRGCVPAIQIVEVEEKVVINTYEAEGDEDVRVSELNQIVSDGYTGGFTLTLHGGALIFDEPFVCAALVVNSTDALTITTDGAEIAEEELAKIALNDVAGEVTYEIPVSPLATTLNGVVYTIGVGSEEAPAPVAYVADGSMTLKDGTFYVGTTYSGTASTVNFIDTIVYGLGENGFGVGNQTFNLYGTTAIESQKFILSQGGAGRTSVFTMNDESSVTVTGSSIVDSNQSSIMFGHWNGPSTFTLNDNATFIADEAQVLIGKTGNAHTININGGTFTAKGIKASGSATGANNLNWIGGEICLGELGLVAANQNYPIWVNVTNEVTLTATAETLPFTQPITGPGTIYKQGDGMLELEPSFANFTGKLIAAPEDVISLTNNVLPLKDGTLAKIEGTVRINAVSGDNFFKICEGVDALPENLTILGSDDQEITQLCIVDGDLYYGNAEGAFELTPEEIAAIEALTNGGVFVVEKPTLNIKETCENMPGGFTWKREGVALYFFKKSNSISLKLGTRTSNKESAILKTDTNVGGFPVAGVVWNNGRIWNDNSSTHPFTDYMKLMDGNGEMTEATIAYRAPNTYFNSGCPLDSGNQRLTSTYLDDGSDSGSTIYTVDYSSQGLEIPEGGIVLPAAPNARGWEMKLSDIPYEMYDLYVYIASDQPQNGFKGCPVVVSIDGENWTYYAGSQIGSDASVWTPDVYSTDGTVTEGKNYIRFRISKASMQAEDISTIYLTHGTRNTGTKKRIGLAGIQIVEIDDDGVRNFVGTSDWVEADAWQTSKGEIVDWQNVQPGEVLTAIINADDHNEIMINENVEATTVKIMGVNPENVFSIYGANTLTAQTIDATLFAGTLNLIAPIVGPIGLGPKASVLLDPDSDISQYQISTGRVIIPVTDTRSVVIPANLASAQVEVTAKEGANLQMEFDSAVPKIGYIYAASAVVETNGIFDIAASDTRKDYSHPIVLAGGTLVNSGSELGENTRQYWQMSVTADSTIEVSGNMFGSVNSGKAGHNYVLNGNTVTKTGEGEYYIANATFDTGKFVVSEGMLVLDQYTVATNNTLTIEIGEGATLKLAGTQHLVGGTLNIINNGGTLELQSTAMVGDFLGTGSVAGNGSLTIAGLADYPAVPATAVFDNGATIRLAAGLNKMPEEIMMAFGSVTFDAVEGAEFKGKGDFVGFIDGEPTFTDAFKQALKKSGKKVEFIEEIGVVEIKPYPQFLLIIK